MKINKSYNNKDTTHTLGFNQGGLTIPSIGITDTMVTGTVGGTLTDFNHQPLLSNDNQTNDMITIAIAIGLALIINLIEEI